MENLEGGLIHEMRGGGVREALKGFVLVIGSEHAHGGS